MVKARTFLAAALVFAIATPQAFALHRGGQWRSPVRLSTALLVAEMNRERAEHGLAPLRLNQRLSLAADDRMQDMFVKHYFEHVSPDGVDPFSWVDKRGYDYTEVGENLAVGYPTALRVVNGWMSSPSHRENVLKPAFDEIGIAIAAGSPTGPYYGPTVVALYGTRR